MNGYAQQRVRSSSDPSPVGKQMHQDDSKTAFRGKGISSQRQDTTEVFHVGMFGTELALIFSHNSPTFGCYTYDDILKMFTFFGSSAKMLQQHLCPATTCCHTNWDFCRPNDPPIRPTNGLDPLQKHKSLFLFKELFIRMWHKAYAGTATNVHTFFCLKRWREKKEKYRIKQNISMRKAKKTPQKPCCCMI